MDDDVDLLQLAAAISDGEAVDWDAQEVLGLEHRSAVVRSLRMVAEVAELHRLLQSPPVAPDSTHPDATLSDHPGERIGPYKLLEIRGEGGMGVVYLAEQSEPMRRRVALKVIKHGMDTKHVIARFEAERQALALMNHAAIARMYDAGQTPAGRPYFVMEYVQGVPITGYCDQHRLTNRERLEMFLQVCDGVQHAHQKAVIHRDLKPSNVLVTIQDGRPAVKIIDFGVAKALTGPLTERTLHTELGTMIGTPEYMSPEQADMDGQDVDTRTDVYSLGVLLYELLIGVLPFDWRRLREAGFHEIRRVLREDDPLRPSARLSSLGAGQVESAQLRRSEPKTLHRELRGDLDWITMKALAKNPSRRYGSPSELADEIRRYLSLEPVLARAPSRRYLAWKFARRHRVAVAVAAIVLASLATTVVGSTVGLLRARRAEAQALQEARTKGRVVEFLKNVFKVADPNEPRGRSVTARELLDQAAKNIDTELGSEPRIRAELTAIMGETFQGLGLYDPAEALLLKAIDIQTRELGPEHEDTLRSMNVLAKLYWNRTRSAEAERLFAQVLETAERRLGSEHRVTLEAMQGLASVLSRVGRYVDAERLQIRLLATCRRALGDEDPMTLVAENNLAVLYYRQGRFDEALPPARESAELEERVLGPDHGKTLFAMNNLAAIYLEVGRSSEAEKLFVSVLERRRRTLGPEHPETLWSMAVLGEMLADGKRYVEAEPHLSEAFMVSKRVLGPEHGLTLGILNNLGRVSCGLGRCAEGERLALQALETLTRVHGPGGSTLDTLYTLAWIHARRGDRAQAMQRLRQAVDGGYLDVKKLTEDTDLAPLHGPEFDVLLEKARQNASAARVSG